MRPSIALLALGTCALVLGVLFLPATACGCSKISAAYACLSNVKRQALGLVMYAEDSDGRYPARDVWMDGIGPYVKGDAVLHDPEFAKKRSDVYGYAFNGALSRAKEPSDPVRTPMIYDSSNTIRNASDLVTSLPDPGRHKGGKRGRDVIGYADGHAKLVFVGGKP